MLLLSPNRSTCLGSGQQIPLADHVAEVVGRCERLELSTQGSKPLRFLSGGLDQLLQPRAKNGVSNLSPRRSATMLGLPHCGGGAAPGGGGGEFLPTKANRRPTKCSGGQVANAMRPPGFSTRRICATVTSGRGANMWPNWLTTTSNWPSGKGRLSASPSSHWVAPSLATRAFSRATSSRAGVRSSPVTDAPARAAVIATTPVPVPTSSTVSPGLISANSTRCAATGVVKAAVGANDAHAGAFLDRRTDQRSRTW